MDSGWASPGWGPGLRIFSRSQGDSGASDLAHELRHRCTPGPPGAHSSPTRWGGTGQALVVQATTEI